MKIFIEYALVKRILADHRLVKLQKTFQILMLSCYSAL